MTKPLPPGTYWIASPCGVTKVEPVTWTHETDGTYHIKGHWAGRRQSRPSLRVYPSPPRMDRALAKRDYDQFHNWRTA